MNPKMKEKIEARRAVIYRLVKNNRPDLYQAAIRTGELARPIFHPDGTDELHIAAEVEACAMQLVARALGLDSHD